MSVDRRVSVGKTCLLVRFHDGIFLNGTCIATIGIDFRQKIVSIGDKQVGLQIFDTVNSLVGVIPHARWTFGFKLSDSERGKGFPLKEKNRVILDSPSWVASKQARQTFSEANLNRFLFIATEQHQAREHDYRVFSQSLPETRNWRERERNLVIACHAGLVCHRLVLLFFVKAGQERFRSITHSYYRDANALLLLYDVTSYSSFENVALWLNEIKQVTAKEMCIMLIGNKVDKSQRVVSREAGERLARDFQISFLETSAKTGQNVELAFMATAQELLDREFRPQPETQPGKNTIKLKSKHHSTDSTDWCCWDNQPCLVVNRAFLLSLNTCQL